MRPKAASLEELERELHEEKIKQEIIARKIAQRRMIEEQVRREFEMRREMMASIHGARYYEPMNECLNIMVPEERFGPPLHRREAGFEERFGPRLRHREFEFEDRFGPNLVGREVEVEERLMLCHSRKVEVGEKLPMNAIKSGIMTANEVKSTKDNISGVKRKAALISRIKFPQPAQKDWSCALCHVSATSEEGLNDHLKGKKHLAKAAELRSPNNSAGPKNSSNNSSLVKKFTAPDEKVKIEGKKIHILVNGKMQEVVERGLFLWCLLCKVKCTSKDNMVTHLCGKKHKIEEGKNSLKQQLKNAEVKPDEEQ